jgi:hypothetical protein
MGIVSNKRVIKNLRKEVDIVLLQRLGFEKHGARVTLPHVIIVEFLLWKDFI